MKCGKRGNRNIETKFQIDDEVNFRKQAGTKSQHWRGCLSIQDHSWFCGIWGGSKPPPPPPPNEKSSSTWATHNTPYSSHTIYCDRRSDINHSPGAIHQTHCAEDRTIPTLAAILSGLNADILRVFDKPDGFSISAAVAPLAGHLLVLRSPASRRAHMWRRTLWGKR